MIRYTYSTCKKWRATGICFNWEVQCLQEGVYQIHPLQICKVRCRFYFHNLSAPTLRGLLDKIAGEG